MSHYIVASLEPMYGLHHNIVASGLESRATGQLDLYTPKGGAAMFKIWFEVKTLTDPSSGFRGWETCGALGIDRKQLRMTRRYRTYIHQLRHILFAHLVQLCGDYTLELVVLWHTF